ncbi:MAG: 4-amino-4-deoxy-L-arabinose transferase and related glycosyltransferase of family-like protein, partial [Phycisphaerales bacterium]|nr:4-amino-4-deoxy-L-arabinose transferase and related glycosyltransferase of family-like protein [Phycisphaerales bacterium]
MRQAAFIIESTLIAPKPAEVGETATRPRRATLGATTRRTFICRTFVVLCLTCIFAASFALYTRHNDFPAYYHDDEADKAAQITRNDRNFNHPQLMLECAQIAAAATHTPPEIQPTVEIGRATSAALAALGVAAMALAGFRLYGFPGLIVTALAVGLCPALLVYAHYMKEDASLIAGVGLCVLAAQVAWSRRGRAVDVLS